MSETAWYLGCSAEDVAGRAILVGDPGRIELFASELDGARTVGESRGLRVLTGAHRGEPVTVCAFGMGAPIAVIVLEELAQLGVRTVLRVGTVMTLVPDSLGELVLARAGIREEGTSRTYLPAGVPAIADEELLDAARGAIARLGVRYRVGVVASLDGFYSQMFAARPDREEQVAAELARLARAGAIAVDMETAALLAVAPLVGVRAGSLCLASVDAWTREKLERAERTEAEEQLVRAALAVIRAPIDAFRPQEV
jgi:uridine phosphorylase